MLALRSEEHTRVRCEHQFFTADSRSFSELLEPQADLSVNAAIRSVHLADLKEDDKGYNWQHLFFFTDTERLPSPRERIKPAETKDQSCPFPSQLSLVKAYFVAPAATVRKSINQHQLRRTSLKLPLLLNKVADPKIAAHHRDATNNRQRRLPPWPTASARPDAQCTAPLAP